MDQEQQVERHDLAIECAVGHGSVAILRGVSTIVSTGGNEKPSRAEEVLTVVKASLNRAELSLHDISNIIVSTGPGSYSGIRIGMATALGLGRSMSKTPTGVSVLDALTLEAPEDGCLITAVEVGKRHTAWASFQVSNGLAEATGDPVLETDVEFLAKIRQRKDALLIWSEDLARRLSDSVANHLPNHTPHKTLAELIGFYGVRFPAQTSLVPQYLRTLQVGQTR